MTDDDSKARMALVEERIRRAEQDVRVFAPLVSQFAVMEERFANLRDDLNDGLKAIREEVAEMRREATDRAKERRTIVVGLLLAGVGLIGTFAAQIIQLRGGK